MQERESSNQNLKLFAYIALGLLLFLILLQGLPKNNETAMDSDAPSPSPTLTWVPVEGPWQNTFSREYNNLSEAWPKKVDVSFNSIKGIGKIDIEFWPNHFKPDQYNISLAFGTYCLGDPGSLTDWVLTRMSPPEEYVSLELAGTRVTTLNKAKYVGFIWDVQDTRYNLDTTSKLSLQKVGKSHLIYTLSGEQLKDRNFACASILIDNLASIPEWGLDINNVSSNFYSKLDDN